MMWYYSCFLAVCHLTGAAYATCPSGTNCTGEDDNVLDVSVERVEMVERTGIGNLAWLVTPALFGLGVMYLIYKCCKDGLCNCRRLRQRAVLEYHREHGYIPLSQVVLHTTTTSGQAPDPSALPPLPPGLRRHLVVIHNQTFCITLRDPPPHSAGAGEHHDAGQCCCPGHPGDPEGGEGAEGACEHACPGGCEADASGGGGSGADEDGSINQQPPPPPLPTIVVKPPTYEEATDGQQGGGRPPRYSEACCEGLPDSSPTSQEEPTKLPRQVRFDTTSSTDTTANMSQQRRRRRHFSAQERRILEQLLASAAEADTEDGPGMGDSLRQRCFSFNALRDAFRYSPHHHHRRRNSSNTEHQILLQQRTTTEVFTAAVPRADSGGDGDDDSVFMSVELLGPPPAGPLPDNMMVLSGPEDLDLAGLLSSHRPRHASGPPADRGFSSASSRARQRHASAPDPSRRAAARSRHSSGHQ